MSRNADLLERLAAIQPRNGTCQVTMTNNCPADWGAVIVAAGCKFFYDDGTDYTDGPVAMNVGTGGSYTFVSDKAAGCVQGILLAATVELPNQNRQTVTASEAAPTGECLIHVTESLGPQNSGARHKLGERQVRFASKP
jgi:hypothetical protein